MSLHLLFLLLIAAAHWRVVPTDAARSLSARRVRGAPSARSADKYDRSITTFNPEGRLLQLEYALVAAEERGRGLTVCVECDGVVIFAFPSSGGDDDAVSVGGDAGEPAQTTQSPSSESTSTDSNTLVSSDGEEDKTIADDVDTSSAQAPPASFAARTEHDPAHNTKIHRLSPTHLLLTSGLAGDSRMLASAFRRVAAAYTHVKYGEVVSARELALEMGKVRHGIGLQPGARVLGVVGMLIGLDDVDDGSGTNDDGDSVVEVRMYRSLPGGTVDRCNVCCTGGGADAAGNAARKEAVETLLDIVATPSNDEPEKQYSANERSLSAQEQKLQRIIEEVGQVVLKHHPDLRHTDELPGYEARDKKRVSVDVWMVRAVAAESVKQNERKPAFVNHHRYLRKSLMDIRCARRVVLNQLSVAAKCLIAENANI